MIQNTLMQVKTVLITGATDGIPGNCVSGWGRRVRLRLGEWGKLIRKKLVPQRSFLG